MQSLLASRQRVYVFDSEIQELMNNNCHNDNSNNVTRHHAVITSSCSLRPHVAA